MIATIVDPGKLLTVIEAAVIAGVGISVAFSLVILGTARAGDLRRQDRSVAATAYAALAVVALAVCALAVVYGLQAMLHK